MSRRNLQRDCFRKECHPSTRTDWNRSTRYIIERRSSCAKLARRRNDLSNKLVCQLYWIKGIPNFGIWRRSHFRKRRNIFIISSWCSRNQARQSACATFGWNDHTSAHFGTIYHENWMFGSFVHQPHSNCSREAGERSRNERRRKVWQPFNSRSARPHVLYCKMIDFCLVWRKATLQY